MSYWKVETMYLNPYAAPAIIASIVSICLGVFVYFKNPKNIQNRVFVLFILFIIIFCFGEVLLRFSSNIEEALLWGRMGYIGAIFVPITFLHLSFVFSKEHSIPKRYPYILFGMYLSGIVLLSTFNLIISSQDIQLSRWGYYRLPLDPSIPCVGIGILIMIALVFAVFNLARTFLISKSAIEKRQIKYMFYGAFIATIITIATNVIFPILGIDIYPMAIIAIPIFSFFVGLAVLKYDLFVYIPMAEFIIEPEKIALLNRDELEKEVKARTVALAKSNEELKIEVLERKNTEKQIENALMEKEILLREIHHRVKNNLQIISSLIYLQSKKTKDNEINDTLLEVYNRIRSMSLIHETLYQSKNLAEIDFNNYIKKLTNELFRSYGINTDDIKLKLRVNEVKLVIDTAISCGLIINELVSNSLKHAFPNSRKGEIHISLDSEDKKVILMVSDDGTGLPDNLNIQKTDTLGLQLIRNLVKQLDGKLEIYNNNGAKFKISFTVLKDE